MSKFVELLVYCQVVLVLCISQFMGNRGPPTEDIYQYLMKGGHNNETVCINVFSIVSLLDCLIDYLSIFYLFNFMVDHGLILWRGLVMKPFLVWYIILDICIVVLAFLLGCFWPL